MLPRHAQIAERAVRECVRTRYARPTRTPYLVAEERAYRPLGGFSTMSDQTTRMRPFASDQPITHAVERALSTVHDHSSTADLLFLERWEISPVPGAAAALRVGQLRRANPTLAAEIREELAARRR